ncbi:alpha/beta hydrolase [Glycomyces sp. YM15]|uniref:RBBP9/YdeN family alpha/beta hydrolase n=1 Tax=Glycomyces sp. YM15 TaxID=2800446 RepID=UPI001962C3D8|nr:alpha/beta hydrolase [Glycomyces sp. YM15]
MWTRSFLILHGVENRRPAGHWQHELAMDLRERGEQVFYPQLPETDRPKLADWTDAIRAELALMRGEKIVLCHSLACAAWMHLAAADAASSNPASADRVLLVSPPGPEAYDWDVIAGFSTTGMDLAGLRLAGHSVRLACSDNDPYCADGAAEQYGRPLGCEVDLLPGDGHITFTDGYGRWPSALAWCLDETERLTPNH